MLDPKLCRRRARRSGDVPDGQHPKRSAKHTPGRGARSTLSGSGGWPVAPGMCRLGNIQSAAQSTRPAGVQAGTSKTLAGSANRCNCPLQAIAFLLLSGLGGLEKEEAGSATQRGSCWFSRSGTPLASFVCEKGLVLL
eukprot:2421347-Rhodomonas_salina.1